MIVYMMQYLGMMGDELNEWEKCFKDKGAELIHDYKLSPDEKSKFMEKAEIVITSNTSLNKEILSKMPNLKMISVAFNGTDHIDMEYCNSHNIVVANTAGYSTNAVAELVFSMILGLYRNIINADNYTRNSKSKHGLIGNTLYGKKIGIVGTGRIGTRVAEIASVFGCELYAFSRTEKDELKKMGVKYLPLEDLLAICDIVTLHVPLTKDTYHLIGSKELNLMKKNAFLINVDRGDIVDELALTQALLKKTIKGAGVDTFSMEPPLPVDLPILYTSNTIFTPHVGYATIETISKRNEMAKENVLAWLEGKPIRVV